MSQTIKDIGKLTEQQLTPEPLTQDIEQYKARLKECIMASVTSVNSMQFKEPQERTFQNGVSRGLRMALNMI